MAEVRRTGRSERETCILENAKRKGMRKTDLKGRKREKERDSCLTLEMIITMMIMITGRFRREDSVI